MQLQLSGLQTHLKQNLRMLYAVHGDEILLQQEAADTIRAHARAQGFTERSVFTMQGAHFDWSAIMLAANSMNLFADKQILDIRIPTGKPGKEGSLALQNLSEQLLDQDSTLALISLGRLDKATKSTAWFAALEQNGVCIQIDNVERAQLGAWIMQRLKTKQVRLKPGVEGERSIEFLIEKVEGNLLAAHQEIEKLALLYPDQEIGFEQLEQAVLDVARYDVYKLSEAIFRGDAARVEKMLQGLRGEGVSEVVVHWTLSEDIRALMHVHDAVQNGKPISLALRERRIWGVKEKLFEHIVPRLNSNAIANLLHAAQQLDGIVKGIKLPDWPSENWVAIERLCAMMLRLNKAR